MLIFILMLTTFSSFLIHAMEEPISSKLSAAIIKQNIPLSEYTIAESIRNNVPEIIVFKDPFTQNPFNAYPVIVEFLDNNKNFKKIVYFDAQQKCDINFIFNSTNLTEKIASAINTASCVNTISLKDDENALFKEVFYYKYIATLMGKNLQFSGIPEIHSSMFNQGIVNALFTEFASTTKKDILGNDIAIHKPLILFLINVAKHYIPVGTEKNLFVPKSYIPVKKQERRDFIDFLLSKTEKSKLAKKLVNESMLLANPTLNEDNKTILFTFTHLPKETFIKKMKKIVQ